MSDDKKTDQRPDSHGGEEEALFYMENGLMVFTEAYHLKRGYCCGSGCRHCPWKKDAAARPDKFGRKN